MKYQAVLPVLKPCPDVLSPPQAELDDMSGVLHCEEGDYKTSFSYFLESYEAFDSQNDVRALRSLKVLRIVAASLKHRCRVCRSLV